MNIYELFRKRERKEIYTISLSHNHLGRIDELRVKSYEITPPLLEW